MAIQSKPQVQLLQVDQKLLVKIFILSLDYIVAIDGSAGPSGAQQAVLQAIQESRVILAAGPLSNSNTEQTFIIEGELDSGLQARIQALGTVDGVDLSGTTATAQTLSIAVGA